MKLTKLSAARLPDEAGIAQKGCHDKECGGCHERSIGSVTSRPGLLRGNAASDIRKGSER